MTRLLAVAGGPDAGSALPTDPTDTDLIRAARRALVEYEVAAMFREVREGFEKLAELFRRAGKAGVVAVAVVAGVALLSRPSAADEMRREGEAKALEWLAGQQSGSR